MMYNLMKNIVKLVVVNVIAHFFNYFLFVGKIFI